MILYILYLISLSNSNTGASGSFALVLYFNLNLYEKLECIETLFFRYETDSSG